MSMYLGKQRQHATAQITATHGTVLQVIQRVEGLSHKIFMDNYFTSPALVDDLFQRKINACGTVHHDRHGMPRDIGPKYLKMKNGDIAIPVGGTLRAVHWKDRLDVYILTNMHTPPVEGNFTQESVQAIKPCVAEDYNAYMGFVDKSEWSTAMELSTEHESGPRNFFLRRDHSKCISYTQIMWWQNDAQKFP